MVGNHKSKRFWVICTFVLIGTERIKIGTGTGGKLDDKKGERSGLPCFYSFGMRWRRMAGRRLLTFLALSQQLKGLT